ncbi:ATP12 family chaperone protein [Acetobacter oeni]|uniref:ATP12 family chaperone protein n=1 Tax=Acetobacter oeni TaxID=304077 RepID=UPI0018581CEC|nr:ATP12 family protein [Acetobacter oeni]MBB3884664.1 chaperone required for assembly of F1-ATPase [Acetobacter oeni]
MGQKRFWSNASVIAGPHGYTVTLDGKPVRLPGRASLRVISKPLAEALAAEWQAAGADNPAKRFGPDALPLTRIAGAMIERIEPHRDHAVATLAGYGEYDLLCYHTGDDKSAAARENEMWHPWLNWLRERHGIDLHVTTGIMPVVQPAAVKKGFSGLLGEKSDAELAALGVAVPALGSLVLGLAVTEGSLSAQDAVNIASLDERTQMQRWGQDPALLDHVAVVAADVMDAKRFIMLATAQAD